jgi:hypothetical protein
MMKQDGCLSQKPFPLTFKFEIMRVTAAKQVLDEI